MAANFANNQGYIDFVDWIKYQFDMGYNPVESDLDTMFLAGQLGMYITGAWLMADLNVYGTNYGVTTLIETPEGGKQAPVQYANLYGYDLPPRGRTAGCLSLY